MSRPKKEFKRADYCQYLLNSQTNYILTNYANHVEKISHDLVTRYLTSATTDDRAPVAELTQGLTGKMVGDKGYISQKLFDELYDKGLQLITKIKSNMKNKLVTLVDKYVLRKRGVIESVNDQLKNISQIEHSRHRSHYKFMVNLI